MGLFLLGLVLIGGGLLIAFHVSVELGVTLSIFGVLFTVILLLVLFNVPVNSKRLLVEYDEDRKYLESVYELEYISEQERSNVVELIMKDNEIIRMAKIKSKSFYVNVFHSKEVGDLELFDISRVPEVNGRQELNIKN